MRKGFVLYTSIWCPKEYVRECVKASKQLFKEMIDYCKDYGDNEGIIFFELTEDAVRNLPLMMVKNMKCFGQENIDTMVFCIKEIKCSEEYIDNFKCYYEEHLFKVLNFGFKSEMIVIREIKIEEENTGKTVGRKNHEILYYKRFE